MTSKPIKVRLDKSLWKRAAEYLAAHFKFDILVQLSNILACITIHELLHLFKEAKDVLREALADAESFVTHIPLTKKVEWQHCQCQWVSVLPSITFSSDDMLVKSSDLDRPLYYTRYIGSTKIEGILIDTGFALRIILVRLLQFLQILVRKLATTTTTMHGFNTLRSRLGGRFT